MCLCFWFCSHLQYTEGVCPSNETNQSISGKLDLMQIDTYFRIGGTVEPEVRQGSRDGIRPSAPFFY
uniref:Putative secreted protein n=1 Tax=Anopheles aquasalis TaxID=42839 RepID=T1DP50_ANOAQ